MIKYYGSYLLDILQIAMIGMQVYMLKILEINNILNALRESSNVGGGSLLGSFTDPRTYGIEFGAKF